MKGAISGELLGMIAVLVMVVAFFGLIFTGTLETGAAPPSETRNAACSNGQSDCIGKLNQDGPLCLSINYENRFCGCLQDSDCQKVGGSVCVENKCR